MNTLIKISNEEYHSRPEVSNSSLGYAKQSMAHYKAFIDGEMKISSESLEFGSMFHMAILEPELFGNHYAVGPNVARNTKEWKEFAAKTSRKVIKPDEYNQVMRMQESFYNNRTASAIAENSLKEMSGFFTDPLTDVECRFRPDIIRLTQGSTVLADVKTTTCASPGDFYWSCVKYGYFRQAAFYMDGYEVVTGERPDAWAIIAIEKDPPYCCEVYVVSPDDIAAGRREYSDLLFRIEECRRLGFWPGYSNGEAQLLTRPERKQ